MDHHTVAAISITGTCLDVLGSLYLAYDLLAGQHGPLRLLTRAVTYSVVFGIGYGLGLFFGLASGIATGITLAIEFEGEDLHGAVGLHLRGGLFLQRADYAGRAAEPEKRIRCRRFLGDAVFKRRRRNGRFNGIAPR